MSEEKSPGQVAFEAYNESKGGLTYDGKPIPPWSSLEGETGEAVKRGWEVAALEVLKRMRLQLDADPIGMASRARSIIAVGSPTYIPLKGREVSLVLTKLDEACLWYGMIPREMSGS